MRALSFSTKSIGASLLEKESNLSIMQPTIILNVDSKPLILSSERLMSRKSSIFQDMTIDTVGFAVSITSEYGFSALKSFPDRELVRTWTNIQDIFPLPHLKNTHLFWRSGKERVGNVAYNLWFAAAGTDCGIHKEHDFLEIHTQIWGTGHMQKFREKDERTIYQDIFMTPGYTHDPFCKESDTRYPWHRYYADTDCIWLAVEYYR